MTTPHSTPPTAAVLAHKLYIYSSTRYGFGFKISTIYTCNASWFLVQESNSLKSQNLGADCTLQHVCTTHSKYIQTWCSCCSTKLVHCWIILPRSTFWHFTSLMTKPSAEASRRVRNVRRKLLAWQFSPWHCSNILNKKLSSHARQNSREHLWLLSEQHTGSRKYKTYSCRFIL